MNVTPLQGFYQKLILDQSSSMFTIFPASRANHNFFYIRFTSCRTFSLMTLRRKIRDFTDSSLTDHATALLQRLSLPRFTDVQVLMCSQGRTNQRICHNLVCWDTSVTFVKKYLRYTIPPTVRYIL